MFCGYIQFNATTTWQSYCAAFVCIELSIDMMRWIDESGRLLSQISKFLFFICCSGSILCCCIMSCWLNWSVSIYVGHHWSSSCVCLNQNLFIYVSFILRACMSNLNWWKLYIPLTKSNSTIVTSACLIPISFSIINIIALPLDLFSLLYTHIDLLNCSPFRSKNTQTELFAINCPILL